VGGWSPNWVHSARRPFTAPGDCEDGEFGGMKIGRGNRSTRRKPAPAPLCPPQIPLDQTRVRTRAAAVGSQRLTAWAMARPNFYVNFLFRRDTLISLGLKHSLRHILKSVSLVALSCLSRWIQRVLRIQCAGRRHACPRYNIVICEIFSRCHEARPLLPLTHFKLMCIGTCPF
jgi:hypothetical protein